LQGNQEHFRALVQNSSDIITVVDAEGAILYQSPAIARILGYEPEERIGKNAVESDLLHPEDFTAKNEAFSKALRDPNTSVTVEVRMRHRDGSWRYVEESITNLLADPNVNGVVLNARCVTQRKRAEQELRESEERFRSVVERTTDGVFMANLDTDTVLESNAALQNMLGYTPEELTGMKLYDIVAEDRESIDQYMHRLKEEKSLFIGERRYRQKDGSLLYVEVSASVVPFKDGEASCCIIRDVTERKALEEQLRYQAFHDSLTDLPNRALFLDRLSQALARTGREDRPVAVLLLDLNHFKMVNDSLGHDAGNVVLVGVAERLRASVRPGDTVGRIFGDEFAVLLEAPCNTEQARLVAGRIQERLRKLFKAEGQEVLVSPSIGIALDEFAQDSPEEVLRRADLAMYAAKKRGKAEYEIYSPSMEIPIANRVELERDLRRAVEREEFEAHYQPIVELQTGEVVGVEALARWRHPKRGLVEAKEFIEIAEETGLVRPIGQRIVEEACQQAEEWSQRYSQGVLMLSVNLSANQFVQQPDLIPNVLDETGLQPAVLQVEITERALIDDAELALAELEALKDLGVSLAIDDFGTGYSGLYHLRHMPIDFLKMDQAFVAGLGDDRGDEAIVSATVGLAHALGVIALAEGVETADQAEILKELGCDLAQGYYFAKPLPREAMEKVLADGGSSL
jgi:diguanylate cyclase (GGDEF)-like protein/PAS domain S-box-containing protein